MDVGVLVGVFVLVRVAMPVSVGVGDGPVGVGVTVSEGVEVNVGVEVPQLPCVKISSSPCDSPPALHSNCVNSEPVSRCTPTVALLRSDVGLPYTISKRLCPSYKRSSKS